MTFSAFETLAAIGDFLTKEVLPVVPKAMSSEVRAMVKLLQNVADELDWLPAVLWAECEELEELARSAQRILGDQGDEIGDTLPPSVASLSSVRELPDAHRESSERVTTLVPQLQARIRTRAGSGAASASLGEFLDRCYETLGRHAETRLRWQSVFAEKQGAAIAERGESLSESK